jgi:hypothetical protein
MEAFSTPKDSELVHQGPRTGEIPAVDAPANPPTHLMDVHSVTVTAVIGGYLCFVSGFVNAVSWGGDTRTVVTHVTGTATLLAWDVAKRRWVDAVHQGAKMITFFLGAVVSGGAPLSLPSAGPASPTALPQVTLATGSSREAPGAWPLSHPRRVPEALS